MSKILIINYFFGDDRVPTARMVNDICLEFKKKKINFKVYCSTTNYKNIIGTVRKNNFEINSYRFFNFKFINYFIFYLSAIFHACTSKYNKILILTDPPLFIIFSPIIKFFNPKSEIIYWTMDLYPEALKASKIFLLNNIIIFKILKFIKNISLKYVDKMINLGLGQKRLLNKYSNSKKIIAHISHPWDLRLIKKITKKTKDKFLKKYNIIDKKIVLYAGNIGLAHSINTLINLINFCEKRNTEFFFIFACKGKRKKKLYNQLKSKKNVLITDYFSSKETSQILSMACCHIITLENEWADIVYPSKLFGIIKTKKPVVFIGPSRSDIAKFIKLKNFGKVFKNGEKPYKILKSIEIISNLSILNRESNYDKNPKEIVKFVLN